MIRYALAGLLLLLAACTSPNHAANLPGEAESKSFTAGGIEMYGKEGRLGFAPQGDSDLSRGGHFLLYFWGKPEELADTYSLVGEHVETGLRRELYPDWEVSRAHNPAGADAHSGAKFTLDEDGQHKGKWRLEIYMGEKFFDSIEVEAR